MQLTHFQAGIDRPFFLIAGPCVIEGETLTQEIAGRLKEITSKLKVNYIFKASYDKANRSSAQSFRGPGLDAGLKVLQGVKDKIGVPVLTDVHEDTPFEEVASVVDVMQTPAFLCARPTSSSRSARRANRSTSRRASSSRRGKCRTWSTRRAPPVTSRSWCASAAFRSATTISSRTCARWPSCATRVRRSFSMPRTRSNYRAGRAGAPADSASTSRCWRARRSRPASRAFSWKHIRIPPRR